MRRDYEVLLESTISHLQQLKGRGVEFVPVQRGTLTALAKPVVSTPLQTGVKDQNLRHEAAIATEADGIANRAKTSADASKRTLMSRADKEAAIQRLREVVEKCQLCPSLVAARKNVVFGVGDIHSSLMFVGEAPGADEDEQGEPFVGKAGQLLTRIIETMGYGRDSVYIANILKCRPDTPGQTAGNRKPTANEMKTCTPHLLAQIEIIRPRVIVALGGTAVEGLFGATQGITRLRGNWQMFRDIPVMPTYHPAYLLRNQSLREKRKVWEDMLQVLEKLQVPITEKQRGYFLKAA